MPNRAARAARVVSVPNRAARVDLVAPAMHSRAARVRMGIRAMRRAFLPTTPIRAASIHTASRVRHARKVRVHPANQAVVVPITQVRAPVRAVRVPVAHGVPVVRLVVATAVRAAAATTVDLALSA